MCVFFPWLVDAFWCTGKDWYGHAFRWLISIDVAPQIHPLLPLLRHGLAQTLDDVSSCTNCSCHQQFAYTPPQLFYTPYDNTPITLYFHFILFYDCSNVHIKMSQAHHLWFSSWRCIDMIGGQSRMVFEIFSPPAAVSCYFYFWHCWYGGRSYSVQNGFRMVLLDNSSRLRYKCADTRAIADKISAT